jgi:arylsulfatase A-like enzyme
MLLAVLAESLVCLRAGFAQSSIAFLAVGLWAVPGALLSCLLAWVLATWLDEESLVTSLLYAWSARRGWVLAGLLTWPAFLLWVFLVARFAARFHNVELAAALQALAALAGLVVLGALATSLGRALGRRRETGARLLVASSLVAALQLLVVGYIVLTCVAGLAQLTPGLLAAPLAFVVAFVLFDVWDAPARPGAVLTVLIALALVTGASWYAGRAAPALATHGAWSRHLIAGIQQLSDFDRDGYSGLLGGGDCAPFDARVGPGAAEIVGDGIDNNCIGGDAGKAAEIQKPLWGESAHRSPLDLNLVVVTVETLRADHASFIGATRDTTPNLRRLAQESLVFERMYSSAPLTRLGVASLFSSFAPSEIEWIPQAPDKRMRHLGPSTPWLPELLARHRYETIAVLTDFSAFTLQEDAGFERGFRHYDTSTKLEYRGGTMWGFPAAQQVDKALAHVERAEKPFLLWLHFFEPHFRYEQPPGAPLFGRDEQARYDAEIWHVDHELGRLVEGLRRLQQWDRTVMLVTGDHGEAFGEHDDRWHGSNLFDPQMRPAALLRVPGVRAKRVSQAVTFTDLAPTFARVLDQRDVFDELRGRSLAPLMHHDRLPKQLATGFVTECFSVDDGHAYQAAYVDYPLKLIYVEQGRRFSFYDLEADPGEQRPLEPGSDPRALPLMSTLVGYLERARPRSLSE